MTRSRRQFLSVVAGSLAVLSFLILSSFAVVWANGLKFNRDSGTFERTVLIAIDSPKIGAEVWLNGEKVSEQIPYRLRHLAPGRYVVEIIRDGYNTWRQTFRLSEGQIGLIDNPILIARSPLVTAASTGLRPVLQPATDYGLNLDTGELTDKGVLVTRFAAPPLQIHRFNDYYLYQIGNQLRLFVVAGTQDWLIYQSQSDEILPITLFPGTWQVALTDQGQVKLLNLTIPTETN